MGLINSVKLAKWVMKLWSAKPIVALDNKYHLSQIFNTTEYRDGNNEEREEIEYRSALYGYEYDKELDFFENYFYPLDLTKFKGKCVLDIGSFTGGRLIHWVEKYEFESGAGIDIDDRYAAAGKLFAERKNVSVKFYTGCGESLPFPDASFDVVVSSDVFEHVEDLSKVMKECHRVLKTGGQLFCVFPQFYQPLESHFGLITKMPGLHWVFSCTALTTAFDQLERERGEEAYWYSRNRAHLLDWEKLYGLNGTTVRGFRKNVKSGGWTVKYTGRDPILSDGRRAKKLVFRIMKAMFILPARMPLFEELFLGRIVNVLEKKNE